MNWLIKKINGSTRKNIDNITGTTKITKIAITFDMITKMSEVFNNNKLWNTETEWRHWVYERLGVFDMLPKTEAKTDDSNLLKDLSDEEFALITKLLKQIKN